MALDSREWDIYTTSYLVADVDLPIEEQFVYGQAIA